MTYVVDRPQEDRLETEVIAGGGADFHGDNMRPTYGGADR